MAQKKDEKKLYAELGVLTKDKNNWHAHIGDVGSLLDGHSPKITAKALWLLGEMGLLYPVDIEHLYAE